MDTYYIKITAEGIQHEQLLSCKEDWKVLEQVLEKIKREAREVVDKPIQKKKA